MEINGYHISQHGIRRMAQRGIPVDEAAIVMTYGREVHCAGATFFFLGSRDLPRGREHEWERLNGVTVVVANDEVLTVYRNPKAISKIKRKPRRRLPAVAHY